MLSMCLRFITYVILTFLIAQAISIEGFGLGILSEYRESSLTESMQSIFILASSLLFFVSANLNTSLKPVSLTLSAFMLMIFFREQDFYLDKFVFDGAWQIIVFIVFMLLSIYLWKARRTISKSVEHYSSLMSSGFLLCGLVVVLVFSRLMGRGVFWKSVLGEEYASLRRVKNIVEESVELLGYSLILFAAIELCLYTISVWRSKGKPCPKNKNRMLGLFPCS